MSRSARHGKGAQTVLGAHDPSMASAQVAYKDAEERAKTVKTRAWAPIPARISPEIHSCGGLISPEKGRVRI